jgi:glycosyltransferase involved in cell wall biosynthesis
VGRPAATEGDLRELVTDDRARLITVPTLGRPIRPWADGRALGCLLRIMWTERPQIMHTHMAKAGALGRLAGILYNCFGHGRRPGRRAVLIHTFHGHVLDGYFSPRLAKIFLTIERWLARRTDLLIAVSPSIQEELLSKGIGHASQWRVIPLGLDLSALAQLPLPNGASPVRIGMVARLVPIKHPSLFLHAVARLTHEAPGSSVRGVIVGDGPLRHALECEAEQLGVDRAVQFTGWQRDLRSVYDGLDVVCLTSWNEGTPVALIEAMAAGRAVVATDVGGVRDLLDEEPRRSAPIAAGTFRRTTRGLLVRPGDVEGVAHALRAVATDAALRRELGEAARPHVLSRFSIDRLLRDITDLYDALPATCESR